jgi:hypothetical protein
MRRSRRGGPTARGSRGAPTAPVAEEAPLLQLRDGRNSPTARRRLEEIRQQRLPRRASASRARSGANVPRSGLRFFLFLKTDFMYRLGIADMKNNLFFVS